MNKNNRTYWSCLQVTSAMVRVTPQRDKKPGIVYRVKNLVDLGNGKKTAVLETVSFPEYQQNVQRDKMLSGTSRAYDKTGVSSKKAHKISIPQGIDNIDLVCTSKQDCMEPDIFVPNVYEAMRSLFSARGLGQIVPDVVAPGDYLVFRHKAGKETLKLSHALRPMSKAMARK